MPINIFLNFPVSASANDVICDSFDNMSKYLEKYLSTFNDINEEVNWIKRLSKTNNFDQDMVEDYCDYLFTFHWYSFIKDKDDFLKFKMYFVYFITNRFFIKNDYLKHKNITTSKENASDKKSYNNEFEKLFSYAFGDNLKNDDEQYKFEKIIKMIQDLQFNIEYIFERLSDLIILNKLYNENNILPLSIEKYMKVKKKKINKKSITSLVAENYELITDDAVIKQVTTIIDFLQDFVKIFRKAVENI